MTIPEVTVMDHFEGRCWLDWWVNSSTAFSVEMDVVITASDTGWQAHGHLTSDTDEERDGFVLLCELDPVFTLRFQDGSTIDVTVHPTGDHRRFTRAHQPGLLTGRLLNQPRLR